MATLHSAQQKLLPLLLLLLVPSVVIGFYPRVPLFKAPATTRKGAPPPSASSSQVCTDSLADGAVRALVEAFAGDFDNYEQVRWERQEEGLTPGPGGGHENIHCRISPIAIPVGEVDKEEHEQGRRFPLQLLEGGGEGITGAVSAKYYFNGLPSVVFRYRIYTFRAMPPKGGESGGVEMRLWRLLPEVEALLRKEAYSWGAFDWREAAQAVSSTGDASPSTTAPPVAERMVGCEIGWTVAAQGNAGGEEGGTGEAQGPLLFEGLMAGGDGQDGTWITSQTNASLEILIKDDLKLFEEELWVNDRGFDREGNFVYGNQRNVPYKLQRVRPKGGLEWTLGGAHCPAALYKEKMEAIGEAVRPQRPKA